MGLYFVAQGAGARPSSIVYDREAAASRSRPGGFRLGAALRGAEMLHLSGITPALGTARPSRPVCGESGAGQGIRVSFDGNYRAQLWEKRGHEPRAVLTSLVAEAEIFFGNHRDISLLLGREFAGMARRGGDMRRWRRSTVSLISS